MKVISVVLLLALFASCVGTVEDKNPQSTKNASYGSKEISFSGIVKAVGIANDKIEVSFLPASGNPQDLTYKIYVNNSLTPLEIKGDSLVINQSGNYQYVVENLRTNTEYSFGVGVANSKTGEESNNNKTLFAKTLTNNTAIFGGISRAAPLSGASGRTTVKVEWIPAQSSGRIINLPETDPVAYEVRYISSVNGTPQDLLDDGNQAVQRDYFPSDYMTNPRPASISSVEIANLNPGTKYYFNVRAIHQGFVDYSETITSYQRETNNFVLAASTLSGNDVFYWNADSVNLVTPAGDQALTSVDIRWDAANGPFSEYYVYYRKVGEPSDDASIFDSTPELDKTYLDNTDNNNTYTSLQVNSSNDFLNLSGLESYAYYKINIAACRDVGCGKDSRILGSSINYRVTPSLAPFSGVLNINDPTDENRLDEIEIAFDAPVVSAGYLNKFELYCYENLDDTSPVRLDYNVASSTSKSNCNGLTRLTQSPTSSTQYKSFESVKVRGNFFAAGATQSDQIYCFGAIPVIETNNFVRRNLAAAIVKCKTLEIKVPNIVDFPGATQACSTGTDFLDVSWQAPTAGIYNRFEVFWKEDDGTPFRFSEAVAGAAGYSSTDNLSKTTRSYRIPNLLPGRKYLYGVLSYIDDTTKKYSEYNVNIQSCTIPRPVPRFQEWVDVFAVGPKGDGRVDKLIDGNGIGQKTYLFETLNDQGTPIEVEVQDYFGGNYGPTTTFSNQFGNIASSVPFNGVYGKKDADVNVTEMHQYSNNGIIRFAWKDVLFNSGATSMNQLISTYETSGVNKNQRAYGYRVYRSDDGKKNWIDLTDSAYTFQTFSNSGLLVASSYSERARANDTLETYDAVVFTDYSVKQPTMGTNTNVNRARTYYYKVVPVFNNTELTYERETTNPQHIIKVVLPPENMALVKRFMANRQVCRELGKTIDTDLRQYYTCTWNGVGARGLSSPWSIGSTVYDFGSDLLIDRYELGCDYTRGDYANLNSTFTSGSSLQFNGTADSGSKFKGCLMTSTASRTQDTSGTNHPADGTTYTDRTDYRVGDCIGEAYKEIYAGSAACSGTGTYTFHRIFTPGVGGAGINLTDCTDANNLYENFYDFFRTDSNSAAALQTQGEFGAVYYNRTYIGSSTYNRAAARLRAGGSTNANFSNTNLRMKDSAIGPSRCHINIPTQDNAVNVGQITSRWFPVNYLNDLTYNNAGGSADVDILTAPLSQVMNNNALFDNTQNTLPAGNLSISAEQRFDATTPIARMFSSNDAKLPPLDGLNQAQANAVCSTYKVEVGLYNNDDDTFSGTSGELSKRLMRRTEGIVAAKHPVSMSETEITNREDGSETTAAVTSGSTFNGSCNSYDRAIDDGTNLVRSGESFKVNMTYSVQGGSTAFRPVITTGSSFFDGNGASINTQNCTSRYGLQDIIGNAMEYSSEQMHCNFSGYSAFLGTSRVVGASIPFTPADNLYYDTQFLTWVQRSPDSGRCSFVEAGSARGGSYTAGQSISPAIRFDGNVNTSVVEAANPIDAESVDYVRNGDGFFFDFGQNVLGPRLNANDTLALKFDATVNNATRLTSSSSDPREGRYFNPIVGLPVTCWSNSCSNSADNRALSTTELADPDGDGNDDVADYTFLMPTGSSQILSDGISEIVETQTQISSVTSTLNGSYNYIDSINPGDGSNTTATKNYSGEDFSVRDAFWRVGQGEELIFLNFGSSTFNGSGRFSAHIKGLSDSVQKRQRDVAVRCAVRIGD
ncbi:fibronectin type III domain-containing protein [Halobacteriovorax sp. GB3]|uniref:fibronectin type III domain-containing protein n=1 Tax=Halobacteriovorax sp. GB3 TaxID=2719615 RepID=UPI0023603360|nr:fibronectin type III domain-containing protein [Halobacteriovorax sp. GB3]MDD0854246.1 fibronectin type III domain-containing protein [Halobacteriovorax sp. GB3]